MLINTVYAQYHSNSKEASVFWCNILPLDGISKPPINRGILIVMRSNVKDITGQKFGYLTAIDFAHSGKSGVGASWLCKCDCGKFTTVLRKNLRKGSTVSCGCYGKVKSITHGMSRRTEFFIWAGMIQRCTNPKDPSYHRYGGRGINVCERWLSSFQNFYDDMGDRPKNKSIDRISNNGNYEPSNCKWSTNLEQANNTIKTLKTYRYKRMDKVLTDWAKYFGISRKLLYWRIARTDYNIGKAAIHYKMKPYL